MSAGSRASRKTVPPGEAAPTAEVQGETEARHMSSMPWSIGPSTSSCQPVTPPDRSCPAIRCRAAQLSVTRPRGDRCRRRPQAGTPGDRGVEETPRGRADPFPRGARARTRLRRHGGTHAGHVAAARSDRPGGGDQRHGAGDRARPAPARSSSHARSTTAVAAARGPSSRSTAARCRRRSSKASCSGTSEVPSRAQRPRGSAGSSSLTVARSFSTRWENSQRRSR